MSSLGSSIKTNIDPSSSPGVAGIAAQEKGTPSTSQKRSFGTIRGFFASWSFYTPEQRASRRSFFSLAAAKITQIFSCLGFKSKPHPSSGRAFNEFMGEQTEVVISHDPLEGPVLASKVPEQEGTTEEDDDEFSDALQGPVQTEKDNISDDDFHDALQGPVQTENRNELSFSDEGTTTEKRVSDDKLSDALEGAITDTPLTEEEKKKLQAGKVVVVTTQQGSSPPTFTAYQLVQDQAFHPETALNFYSKPNYAYRFLPACQKVENILTKDKTKEDDPNKTLSIVSASYSFGAGGFSDKLTITNKLVSTKEKRLKILFHQEGSSTYIKDLLGNLEILPLKIGSLIRYEITIDIHNDTFFKAAVKRLLPNSLLSEQVKNIVSNIVTSTINPSLLAE